MPKHCSTKKMRTLHRGGDRHSTWWPWEPELVQNNAKKKLLCTLVVQGWVTSMCMLAAGHPPKENEWRLHWQAALAMVAMVSLTSDRDRSWINSPGKLWDFGENWSSIERSCTLSARSWKERSCIRSCSAAASYASSYAIHYCLWSTHTKLLSAFTSNN